MEKNLFSNSLGNVLGVKNAQKVPFLNNITGGYLQKKWGYEGVISKSW
jgi:hypothetical protein